MLWLAEPWKPHFLAPSDVIVPRLLLFLDHTYGTVTLLTAPLIAVDTACRLRWPLDHERRGEAGEGGGRGGFREGDPGGLDAERARGHGGGAGQSGSLVHIPGFLCCLLVWNLCGCGGGRDWTAEGGLVEVCLETGGSLATCLPDLPTVALQSRGSPSRILASLGLSLLLALNMAALRGGWGQGARTDKRREDAHAPYWPHTRPAVSVFVHSGVKTQGDLATYTHSGVPAQIPQTSPTVVTGSGWCLPWHATSRIGGMQRSGDEGEATPLSPNGDVLLAVPETEPESSARPAPPPRPPAGLTGAPDDRPRPWDRASVLIGLACVAALCLLPPAMAVNAMVTRTVERVAGWGLGRVQPAWR